MSLKTLRIFISSPGDVGQERLIATRVIERLQGEFAAFIKLEPILWEHEPLRASSHFQEQIVPPSQTDIVVCILWSRLGTRLPGQFHREDGSLYQSGTEWEFEDALRSFRERGAPDLMVYRKIAESHASMSDEQALLQRLEQKKALDAFIDRWFGNPQDSFRAAFHAFDSPDKFEELLEAHLHRLVAERLPQRIAEGSEVVAPIVWHKGSPFRGLEAFDVDHAAVFFGRTQAIGGIKESLVAQAHDGCPFVLVLGMSGSGKSSLVRAGVLPTITRPGIIEGIGMWRWAIFRPSDTGAHLLDGLAGALLHPLALPELEKLGLGAAPLATLLREAPQLVIAPLTTALQNAAEAVAKQEKLTAPPAARLCLLLDQLEELFTRTGITNEERETFAAAIAVLARSGLVWIVATMRADFYPRLAEVPALAELKKGAGQYDLAPPSFAEIGQMIRHPARAAGLRFEVDAASGERLEDLLHEAAGRHPEALPLLEFTLDELWKERTEDGVLTLAAYHKLGGLEGALARRAEEVFAAQPKAVQDELPALLRGLVTVGQGNDVVASKRVPLETLATTPERKALLDAFIQARLLVSDRADDGKAVVRVAHEALLNHWPRLGEWLDEDRDFLRVRERVSGEAAHWQAEGKRPDYLLREGKPLAEAEDMMAKRCPEIAPDVTEYIESSSRHVRNARRRKMTLAGAIVGAFFLVVSGFGAFSYRQWKNADQQKQLALDAVSKLTYDIPNKLQSVPGTLPILRAMLDENEGLLNRLGGSLAERERSLSLARRGDTWLLVGDVNKALDSYNQSLVIRQQLARNKGDTAAQRDLSVCYERIGDARRAQNDDKAALDAYRQSLAIRQELVKNASAALDVQTNKGAAAAQAKRDLLLAHLKIGDVLLADDDLKGAAASYGQSLDIAAPLAQEAEAGAAGQARADLAAVYAKLGDVKWAQKDGAGALISYRRSLGIAQELAKNEDDIGAQHDLAGAYERIGNVQGASGDFPAALASFEKSLDILRDLGRDKSNVAVQRDLAAVLIKAASAQSALGDFEAARQLDAGAIDIRLDLARDRGNAGAQRDLVQAYGSYAFALLQGRHFKDALQVASKAAKIDPNDAMIQSTLAHAYLFDGQYEKAVAIYLPNKDRKVNGQMTFAQGVLADFEQFQAEGLTHPQMARIAQLLAH